MRVCFIVPGLSPSGGIRVVSEHARRLAADHGIEVELVSSGAADEAAAAPVRLLTVDDARGAAYDVAIATWWTTAELLYAVEARRRVVFVQSLEQEWYRGDEAADRLPAALPLSLPVSFLAVSSGLREAVKRLRPDAACHLVPNGVDKDVFRPRRGSRGDGPLRVLVEGQPTIWLKGVQDALRAVRRMTEPVHVTAVSLKPDGTEELDADDVRTGLGPEEMAAVYAESDVLLKLSRVEGLGLPAVEAMHVGVPCIVTPFAGHTDYVEHGRNGIVVEFDDEPGTTRWLDALARDRGLLERLGQGALATAERWPDPGRSSAMLADALRVIAEAEAPAVDPALAHLAGRVRLEADIARNREGMLRWHQTALADARTLVEELSMSREECSQMLEEARGQQARLNSSRLYRALRRLRRTAGVEPLWP